MENDASWIYLCLLLDLLYLIILSSIMWTGAQEEGSKRKQEEDFHQEEGSSQGKDCHQEEACYQEACHQEDN